MFPHNGGRKLVVHKLRLKLLIIFEGQVSCALLAVWAIIYRHNILILIREECLPSGSTQNFQDLDTVSTHVTDSGTNMQSSILASAKILIQETHQQVSLGACTAEVVSIWLLPILIHTTDCEN